jgi:transcriptional regulator with XRE-family HTH domain
MQIGNFLKEVRQEKGITIAQAANDLLIQEKYIQAIENGNFEAIPGETYQRAYFKKYAEYLGVAEYIDSQSKSKESEVIDEEVHSENPCGGTWDTARKVRVTAKLLAILIIIFCIPMGIRLMIKHNRAPDRPEPDNRVESTQQVHVLPTDAYPLDFVHESDPEPVTPSENLTHEIILKANGECWVELNTRDSQLFKGTMYQDEELKFDDIFGFRLHTGRPEKVEVYFDGELVPWESGQTDMTLPPGASLFQEGEPDTADVEDTPAPDDPSPADEELSTASTGTPEGVISGGNPEPAVDD